MIKIIDGQIYPRLPNTSQGIKLQHGQVYDFVWVMDGEEEQGAKITAHASIVLSSKAKSVVKTVIKGQAHGSLKLSARAKGVVVKAIVKGQARGSVRLAARARGGVKLRRRRGYVDMMGLVRSR